MAKRKEEQRDFAVPGRSPAAPQQRGGSMEGKGSQEQKPIRLLWLLQHYSKKNAVAYREQRKAAKKRRRRREEPIDEEGPPAGLRDEPLEKREAWSSALPSSWENPNLRADAGNAETWSRAAGPCREEPFEPEEREFPQEESRRARAASDAGFGFSELRSGYGPGTADQTYGETVVLNPGAAEESGRPEANVTLDCVGFGRTIPITKFPFRIGRLQEKVDLCIADNRAVSAVHAEIQEANGAFCIVDLNSLNGVFLDGLKVSPGHRVLLDDGAAFRLGDEEFVFHVS